MDYISSAGLRVILSLEKTMRRQIGKMKLLHVNSAVKEIIKLAGLPVSFKLWLSKIKLNCEVEIFVMNIMDIINQMIEKYLHFFGVLVM